MMGFGQVEDLDVEKGFHLSKIWEHRFAIINERSDILANTHVNPCLKMM